MKRVMVLTCLVSYFTSSAAFEIEAGFKYTQIVNANSNTLEINKPNERAYWAPSTEPNHQDMTIGAIKLGQANAEKTEAACATKNDDWNKYFTVPIASAVKIGMCCAKTAVSYWCNTLRKRKNGEAFVEAEVADSAPVITGSMWPDDPCHLLARKETNATFFFWITGEASEGNNLMYTSHFHDFQFMHSMAASSWKPKKKEAPEDADRTRQKIKTWAEFAFKVADGTIDVRKTIADVKNLLSDSVQKKDSARHTFGQVFGGYNPWTVAEFFTGWKGAPPEQVRQIAAGALLHTIQDSFSDPHADRSTYSAEGISKFSDYKMQVGGSHLLRDQASSDMLTTQMLSAYHPISKGAQLLSCVVAGSSDKNSRWDKAAEIVIDVFKRPDGLNDNLAASPRGYEKKPPKR